MRARAHTLVLLLVFFFISKYRSRFIRRQVLSPNEHRFAAVPFILPISSVSFCSRPSTLVDPSTGPSLISNYRSGSDRCVYVSPYVDERRAPSDFSWNPEKQASLRSPSNLASRIYNGPIVSPSKRFTARFILRNLPFPSLCRPH